MGCCRPSPSPPPPGQGGHFSPPTSKPLRDTDSNYITTQPRGRAYPQLPPLSIPSPSPRQHYSTTGHSSVHRKSPAPSTSSTVGGGYYQQQQQYGHPIPPVPSISPHHYSHSPRPTPPPGLTRPSPTYGGYAASPAPRSTTPGGRSQGGGGGAVGAVQRRVNEQAGTSAEGKLSVGIDFGTTFSGVAYGSSRLFSGHIRQILVWPGSYETYRKVPTCILYSQPTPQDEAVVLAWGLEAKNMTLQPGMVKCEWFKLLLSPSTLRSGMPDPRLPPLPYGKTVVDVISDFLREVWRYARRGITEEIGSVVDLDSADVLLTVPAAWDAAGCSLMREAAIRAGLVQSARGGDKNWRDRLQIITEPEAGAIHASTLSTLHHLRPSQSFLLCDAGGGTVDTAVYKLMGQLSELEIAEMCVRSGATSGSLFIDLKFEELVRRILKDHPTHLDPPSLAAFMHSFSETDKLDYHGTQADDESLFRFNCFNVEDDHDPSVGLEYGELAIPGRVLKTEVFDPIIEQVLDLLHYQLSKVPQTRIDAIILVGGFAASEYLFTRVQAEFGAQIKVIARPNDCDVATLRGAARYGLTNTGQGGGRGRGGVSNVISPRSYIMKVKLPAEDVDRFQRPQFITTNDAGMEVCANRLSYLVAKGAVLPKGERLRSRFCKFVKDPHDSIFTAQLFVSDSEELYRYTDDGDATEICRWTVDLAALPRFHYISQSGGGYVEFDLGLSLDSAEVRGVLMTDDGVDCGTATFEFLGT